MATCAGSTGAETRGSFGAASLSQCAAESSAEVKSARKAQLSCSSGATSFSWAATPAARRSSSRVNVSSGEAPSGSGAVTTSRSASGKCALSAA